MVGASRGEVAGANCEEESAGANWEEVVGPNCEDTAVGANWKEFVGANGEDVVRANWDEVGGSNWEKTVGGNWEEGANDEVENWLKIESTGCDEVLAVVELNHSLCRIDAFLGAETWCVSGFVEMTFVDVENGVELNGLVNGLVLVDGGSPNSDRWRC